MTDYFLGVPPQSMEWELRSNVSRFQSPMGGVTRTLERVGSRWAATWRWDAVAGENAARLKSFLALMRGGANRFWAYDPGYTMRGAYSAAELLTNNTFASGTTGWTAGGEYTLSAADSVAMSKRNANTGNALPLIQTTPVTVTQYAPYLARLLLIAGRGSYTSFAMRAGITQASIDYLSDVSLGSGFGLRQLAFVASSTAAAIALVDVATGLIAGDYLQVPYTSLAPCALVDNAPNMLLRSNDGANAVWTKSETTSGNNGTTAPDGTTTDQNIAETTANAQHYISQAVTVSSSALDYSAAVNFRAINRSWAYIQVIEATGSSFIYAFINLATGAVGTTATGANWSNLRAFVQPLGNGWYRLNVVARKTNAATSLFINIGVSTADNTFNYVGVTSPVAVVWWHASLAQSSVPARETLTTSAATAGAAQTGSAIHLKGLPASTSGLLLAGDWIEFITPTYSELKRVTAPLNSDAAGLGYLQVEPILRASPVDNAAVIIRKPMGRFMLDEPTVKWSQGRAGVYSVSFTAVEDVAA